MKRFDEHLEDFDRKFERAQKWGIVGVVFSITLALGITGFFLWVIVMLLRFFGVV